MGTRLGGKRGQARPAPCGTCSVSLIPRPVVALPAGLLTPSPHCHQLLGCSLSSFSQSALTHLALALTDWVPGPPPLGAHLLALLPLAIPASPPPALSPPLRAGGHTAAPPGATHRPLAAGPQGGAAPRPARCPPRSAPLRPAAGPRRAGPGRAHLVGQRDASGAGRRPRAGLPRSPTWRPGGGGGGRPPKRTARRRRRRKAATRNQI